MTPPGSAGTASDGYRTGPAPHTCPAGPDDYGRRPCPCRTTTSLRPVGRHRGTNVPAVTPRFPRAYWPVAGTGIVLFAAAVGMLWQSTWEPTRAQASTPAMPPAVERADDPGARGGPIGGPLAMPVLVPAGTPVWEPAKGTVIADGQALPRSTGSTATRATRHAPVVTPAPAPPPPGDPLTDDGTFGNGCEQPGTREQCDPDLSLPGLPPVVVPPRDCADPLVECACDHDVPVDCSGNPRTPIGLPPVVVSPGAPDDGEVGEEEPAEEPAGEEPEPATPETASDDGSVR